MNTPTLGLALLATPLLGAFLFAAPAAAGPSGPSAVKSDAPDIVATALAAGTFRTLTTALEAAGLVEALKGPGPFTVFAPTDEAFGRLPAGALESLLAPSRREGLRAVLTYHVVSGRVLSTDLLAATSAKTLGGETLKIGLRVGSANVIAADILCANGVIHVIDEVLLPSSSPSAPASAAVPAVSAADAHAAPGGAGPGPILRQAIERGAPLFNAGRIAECVTAYEEAARAVLALPPEAASVLDRAEVSRALARPAKDATERAWDLRRAFDRVLANESFEPLIEAPMPVGFPAPGPLGRVVEKSYPAYRAAGAAGGRSTFWTLFQHIKSNDIAMTAPVEMTLGDGLEVERMAFLYEKTAQGTAGKDGVVEVADLPAMSVLSITMRGEDDRAAVEVAQAAVEARLASGGYRRAGAWRRLGYNSPMVPSARRTWELQLPVAR